MTPACKVCDAATVHFGRQPVLGKYPAEYRRCSRCGYVFVEDPHWLAEAYGTAIAALDTGIVARNLWLADTTCALLGFSLRGIGRCVDYGGGTGLLVRLMRDRGHDFHWYDAYSPNLLAGGFEADLAQRYDLATAFELVEHLSDPIAGFEGLHALAPIVLFSTELVPPRRFALDQWWYYAPESGQHIGFFTERSLAVVAERWNLRLSSNGRNLHVLAPFRINRTLLKCLRKPARARVLAFAGRGRSNARPDAQLQLQRLRALQTPLARTVE